MYIIHFHNISGLRKLDEKSNGGDTLLYMGHDRGNQG